MGSLFFYAKLTIIDHLFLVVILLFFFVCTASAAPSSPLNYYEIEIQLPERCEPVCTDSGKLIIRCYPEPLDLGDDTLKKEIPPYPMKWKIPK